MAGTLRAMGRFSRMLWHALKGVRIARKGMDHLDAGAQQRQVEDWARAFLSEAGVQLRIEGHPVAQGPVLLVANHQSWLDIPTLHAARHCRFISKAEIANWPIVGHLARAAGTLFVKRSSRRDTQRTVQAMTGALKMVTFWLYSPKAPQAMAVNCCPFTAICCKQRLMPTWPCNRWR